jgi:hypothetical protein
MTDNPMPLELEHKLYYEGIHLFNEHEFFEAHETWEDIWRTACGSKYDFYQGMIQCAVALEHYLRSNPRGVLSLYNSYRPKFAKLPTVFMGLDVPGFLSHMERALNPVLQANPVPEKGSIKLDLATVPTIALQYDPFETGEAERVGRQKKF